MWPELSDCFVHHARDRTILEESNFQLEYIAREASRIVDGFALPEEMNSMEIIDLLQGTIEEGEVILERALRAEMRDEGYQEVFEALLRQVSHLVHKDLRKYFQDREYATGD
ncbi:MAG: hypothetical protein HWN68_12660 [Desulfobacterales bacterium]|nr:hypothetical protein [Desulfobacterales bacterium]